MPPPRVEPPRRSSAPDASLDQALADEREALKALFPLPPSRAAHQRGKGRPARKGAAAAVVSIALLGGLLWLDPAYRTEHHASVIGERKTVELSDGSRLVLDTATRVGVSWHLRSRRSVLMQGRASYAVAPTLVRPFEVEADRLRIHVVGTVFDVRRERDGASVTVHEGQVRVGVAGGGAEILLAPGQRLAAGANGHADVATVDRRVLAAWHRGSLVFERTPLAVALDEIRRYRSAPIRLQDARLGTLEVSGVFDSGNTDQLLGLLPRILPVRVVRAADGAIEIGAQ